MTMRGYPEPRTRTLEHLKKLRANLSERRCRAVYSLANNPGIDSLTEINVLCGAIQAIDEVIREGKVPERSETFNYRIFMET